MLLHGDIGALSSRDIVIAFSKSGGTQKLLHLMPHIEKKGVKTVAVVSTPDSPLGKRSTTVVPIYPYCANCAPLTWHLPCPLRCSLFLGGILSIALMQKKQFSIHEFAANHPGGILGEISAFRVRDLMLKKRIAAGKYRFECIVEHAARAQR